MKTIYLLLPLLLIPLLVRGQITKAPGTTISADSIANRTPLKVYFDQQHQPVDSSLAYLYLVIQADSLQADVWRVEGYFTTGERYYQGSYQPSSPDSLRWQDFFTVDFAKRAGAQGVHTYWYANGQKEQESSYETGLKSGLHQQWYMSGILFTEMPFQQGQAHGKCRVFYPDGSKKMFFTYEAGVLEGEFIDYGIGGQKDRRYRLKKGFVEAELTP